MVKILDNSKGLLGSNELNKDCSTVFKADDPPLEEIDPAILSCGLPAIILSDVQQFYTAPTRYTFSQLFAIRKSALSCQRPAAADDPNISRYAIWKLKSQLPQNCTSVTTNRKDNKDDDVNMRNKNPQDKLHEQRPVINKPHNRENGFVAPRYRRNNDFVHRNHHVIVKSYKREDFRLQDSVIEEEPEWVVSGPTSRLDTIELRGFDEDTKQNCLSASESSSEKVIEDNKNSDTETVAKYVSFYDDLHHYEHMHPKRGAGGCTSKQDTSARENDIECVTTCTSSTGTPPPARSTPTKKVAEFNSDQEKADEREYKKHIEYSGINVNNFEEFMKFDSLLSTDRTTAGNTNNGSRFSKWFRRNNAPISQTSALNNDFRKLSVNENYNHGSSYRYPHERQQQPNMSYNRNSFSTYHCDNSIPNNTTLAYKQLINMINQNRVNNNLLAQQQYLGQLINKTQRNDFLRSMIMKTQEDQNTEKNKAEHKSPQQHRIPTHRELQYHTQTIMQNALLRKKLQDTHKLLTEHGRLSSVAYTGEPNPIVQQFVQSVSPNMQRSLSVLSQTAKSTAQCRPFDFLSVEPNSPLFTGNSQPYDYSFQQLIQPQRSAGNGRRTSKAPTSWN